jgi:hypothetical protein
LQRGGYGLGPASEHADHPATLEAHIERHQEDADHEEADERG